MRVPPSRLVLLGHPVAHSRSPRFQNAALRHHEIPVTYEAVDVAPERLERVLHRLRAEGAGGNVTIPHKERMRELCDRVTPVAARTGAVNAFWLDDGALVGDNTDVPGFLESVESLLGGPPQAAIALIGAGGAARAVIAAAEAWSVPVRVYNRGRGRAERLATEFAAVASVARGIEDAVRDASLIVNATPIGLHDDAHPVAADLIPARAAVLDLVYRTGETAWVRAARARGHRAGDGLGMLVAQGARAFERWFGITADRNVMRRALDEP